MGLGLGSGVGLGLGFRVRAEVRFRVRVRVSRLACQVSRTAVAQRRLPKPTASAELRPEWK